MKLHRACAWLILLAGTASAASEVAHFFVLNTTDADGNPIKQNRSYSVYRPDNLDRTKPAPMVLNLDGTNSSFHRKADQAGFVVVSCSFNGNSSGTPAVVWINDNPRVASWEDYDFLDEVIRRVRESDNISDVFTTGLSKDGHMSMAYACERPNMIRAAATLDEFMQLPLNIPTAPVPVIGFQGTQDTNVPYTMLKETLDAWRTIDGLRNATPVTTFESSPLQVGKVSQATWRGGVNGTQVAMVTLIGGTHTFPLPGVQTGYDYTDGIWAFFSQFLTSTQPQPVIVSQPVNNIQVAGQPASFWVTATGAAPLRYQWQKNGADIPGATSNWYTLPATASADSGATFRAVVANDNGTVTSPAATLTVKSPDAGPVITTQPVDQTVMSGQPVTFSVAATTSAATRYQWTKNGVNIAGATAATYAVPAAITSDTGAAYAAVVTSGTSTTTSVRATLTVLAAPGAPIIIANPDRARVIVGDRGTYTVKAWSLTPMTYQWQKGGLTTNMADIPGATEASYTTPPATLADSPTLFRCTVSNAAGSVTSASEMMLVTADSKPANQLNNSLTAIAQTGVPFQFNILSSGGTQPVRYSADPLPAGLTVDPVSGLISGTPTAAGVTTVILTASNDGGDVSHSLILTVTDAPVPPITLEAWRKALFGASATDPAIAGDDADPDGDGFSNLAEFLAGTNPLDPAL